MLNIFARKLVFNSFRIFGGLRFGVTDASNPDFKALREEFLIHKDMVIFNDIIKASDNTVDNINYFQIYKLLEENNAQIRHYEDFYNQLDSIIQKKSDNIRILMAKMKAYVAKRYESSENYYEALRCLEQALDVLERSMIPPVMVYYQIYRTYGFVQFKLKNMKQAYEALEESVSMIESVLEHSEDRVNSDINCKNQAKACALLAELEPEKEEEWVKKCFESWKDYEGDKFQLSEYAESLVAKARLLSKTNPQKAEELLAISTYQFQNADLKQYMKAKKEEILNKK